MRKSLPILLVLAVAGCGDPIAVTNSAEPAENEAADAITPGTRAVRIGELGANFAACTAAGTTRNLRPGETLPSRAAPFENADVQGAVAAGAKFFICTRTLDQKWFGIVHDAGGQLADRCGVSEPVTRKRDYDGPCRTGWVQSAFVKVIAGNDRALPAPPEAAQEAPAPSPGA